MSDVRLVVNGAKYGGWKSIRVTRSIESIAGSFSLEASDRWGGQSEPWPIVEEDACRVEIDDEVVIDGWVDKRRLALTQDARTLSYEGRDRTSALVDCSAMLGAGKKWSFRDKDIAHLATQLGEEHGIRVAIQPGLKLIPTGKSVLNPGDTAYHALQRLAASTGVLLVSDGQGGLLITRAGTTRIATALVQGENVLSASIDYDATDRFARYVLLTQSGSGLWHELDNGAMPADPAAATKASAVVREVRAQATDEGVRRAARVLMIRPEAGMDTATARRRVDWEARVRAARSAKAAIAVLGWKQRGQLWPLNQLVSVSVPSIGIVEDMLISQVEHTLSDQGGEITQLHLVRPDAFLPEPHAIVRAQSGRYHELDSIGFPVGGSHPTGGTGGGLDRP